MSIAQTTQLLQLVLNSVLMMVIALIWWGVVVFRLGAISARLQRLDRRPHGLRVRYRLNRHSALIMHYVLLMLMASLCCLALRALINANSLITVALVLFVLGTVGILVSVSLALMEFYQLNGLEIRTRTPRQQRPSVLPATRPALHPASSQKQAQHDAMAS
ncbi:MAG: hypothetical protein HC929_01790 [Leptolyngbyaceae cyanobacterium SM2_5_2]|nr:hypothetical protein [Leptolyngbyaceae cyanobacterium SM2_5_2]